MTMRNLLLASALFAVTSPAFAQQSAQPTSAQAQANAPQNQRGQGQFERADLNNDSVITREEVRIARTAAFTRLDTNRDGFLERAEMRAGRAEAGRRQGGRGQDGRGQGGPGDMLRTADANNDGNVTQAEFNTAWASMAAKNAAKMEQRRAGAFERFDTNCDGTITRTEADAARPRKMDQSNSQPNGQRRQAGRVNPDTNSDQKISLAEWLARPDPLFQRADANNDGRVTREEAAATMRQGRGEGGRRGRAW
jgi:Ca2+-binding EF-hand superfamily protein